MQDSFFSVTEKSFIHPDPSIFKIIPGLQHFLVANSFMGNPVLVFMKYTLKRKNNVMEYLY